jgi:tRNA-dihydrouridine synthase
MLEYKYHDNKKILEIFSCLRDLGVEYAYLSTGKISDDITDYIAIARYASDFCGVSIIYNGIMWKYEHFKKVEESGVFGVSFKSLQNFNSVFGVL